MKGKKFRVLLCLLVIGLDRLVKIFYGDMNAEIWPGVIGFRSVHNTGMALGLLSNQVYGIIILTFLLLAVGVFIWRRYIVDGFGGIGVAFLLGGAVGNLLDRVIFGYVIDMFELLFINFYVFNVADVAVVIGTGICVLSILFRPQEWRKRS